MNNLQRICEVCILNGIYTPDELEALLTQGKTPDVHTKNYWKKLGKIPKPNVEGITTKLWKKNNDKEEYFLIKSKLYSASMVTDA
ncbi:MAG: hypothetical protein E7279_08640 [Lachnospiraceae bacterium]|nr:hypothetical protein [Lachnospiraceae bacterium]